MNGKRIVFIGNCDAQGSTPPTGKDAIKARFKGFRWVRYTDQSEDIVIVHSPASPEYQNYGRETLGFCPVLLSPKKVPEPIDLTQSILDDDELIEKIRATMGRKKLRLCFSGLGQHIACFPDGCKARSRSCRSFPSSNRIRTFTKTEQQNLVCADI